MSFGKTVYNSPDAWAYLREASVYPSPGYMKNFERWLYQRDMTPDGTTKADRKVNLSYDPGGTANYEYMARRTQYTSQQNYIYFDLDDRFAVEGPVDIKVEYWDNFKAPVAFRVEYNSAQAPDTPTEWYSGQQDLGIRTVTFTISDAKFQNALPGGMDFRLATNRRGDLTVHWVRVIRTSLPDIPTSIRTDHSAVPTRAELSPNYPNPFNPETHLRMKVSHTGLVSLAIYDLLGRKVRTLVDEVMPAGDYTVTWDGQSDVQRPSVSGVYIVRLQTSGITESQKILLLR